LPLRQVILAKRFRIRRQAGGCISKRLLEIRKHQLKQLIKTFLKNWPADCLSLAEHIVQQMNMGLQPGKRSLVMAQV
jgi:hypothetical protein